MDVSTSTVALLMGFFGFRSRRVADKVRAGAQSRHLLPSPDMAPTPVRPAAGDRPACRLPDLPPREMARLHAEHLLAWLLDAAEFEPGTVMDAGEMTLTYLLLCERNGWKARPWNSVAVTMNRALGGKRYMRRADRQGIETQVRVYIVPPLNHRLRKPRKPKADRKPAPQGLQGGMRSAELGRAA
ncbi:MAG: hypothetical protein F9K29_07970 [Hyphomicrobiaceae bacterium]|nr:MAG: hypothetical protein F9K29_07970 [Hyphomicrobiaceae bacterium]